MTLFNSGVRPIIDNYLLEESKKVRDYGNYWSASSAGYCMRKNIFERLKIPHVETEADARKQRVFTSGHIFHSWIQELTKKAGVSIAQELELQDEDLMIRGHIDDLVEVDGKLMLIDYKTQNSRAFSYKRPEMSYFHKMQLGTYLLMLRKGDYPELEEARIIKISKDDLRMSEEQLLWTPELEAEVTGYWKTLNKYWVERKLPPCTCADHEGGFMANEKWNPYYYNGKSCSLDWYKKHKKEEK
jgi:hypothetical protein